VTNFKMLRSADEEILDTAELSDAEVASAYDEIQRVNDWLGNTRAMMRMLRHEADAGSVTVLDIGCARGGMLRQIRERLGLNVVGIDLRPGPVDAAVRIVTGNAVTDSLPEADVAISMLTAHHLSEEELAGLIRNVARSSCRRFILLDLVRHPVPLALFRVFVAPWLCRMNALDGATSIKRAYTAGEMRRIVDEAVAGGRRVRHLRQRVNWFWTRQVVEIWWE
jgi:SAM-dependent methyltransferase